PAETPVREVRPEKTPERAAKAEAPEVRAAKEARRAPAPAGKRERVGIRAKAERLTGPNVVGRIELPTRPQADKPVASSSNPAGSHDQKRKRKRKERPGGGVGQTGGARGKFDNRGRGRQADPKEEPSEKE